MDFQPDELVIAGRKFSSRLIVGTGKYASVEQTEKAIDASGAEIVTVALRRVDINDRSQGSLMTLLQKKKWTLLPNTAGCFTADEAVRTLRLARELGIAEIVKLEVIGDKKTLYPDNEETLVAAKILVKEGFVVLPYCIDDPIVCRKLEDIGCAAVMPLAAPIGSGLGIRNPHNLAIIPIEVKSPQNNAISRLQEICQSKGKGLPRYEYKICREGFSASVQALGQSVIGIAKTKKLAKVDAAIALLEALP